MHTCNFNTEFMLKFPLNRPFPLSWSKSIRILFSGHFLIFHFLSICSYSQFSSTALFETKFPLQSMALPVPTHINHYVHLLPCLPTPNGLLIPSDCMNFHVLRFLLLRINLSRLIFCFLDQFGLFFLFHLSSIHFLHQNRLSFICIISYEAPP